MKVWLWEFLYPVNLWCRVVRHCSWVLRLYEEWLWQPLLEKWLSDNPRVQTDHVLHAAIHICAHCGSMKRLALVGQKGSATEFFCSVACRDTFTDAAPEKSSGNLSQPSI